MPKVKAVIDGSAGNRSISIRLDDDVFKDYEEVKALLKKAGLGRLNMTQSLKPVIEEILLDARQRAENVLAHHPHRTGSSELVTSHPVAVKVTEIA